MADLIDELLGGKRAEPKQPGLIDTLLSGKRPEGAPPNPLSPAGIGESLTPYAKAADDTARSVASGATFSFADEFAARQRALVPKNFDFENITPASIRERGPTGVEVDPEKYEAFLAAERSRDEQIPAGIRIPGEIAGGIASTFAAAPAVGAAGAATGATQFMARLPGWLKASGLGGFYGSLFGAGAAEEGGRAEGAAEGGALGAATGAVTYPLISGVAAGLSKAGGAVKARIRPTTAAQDNLAEAIARDEMTPARVASRLRELGPQAMIADAGGENVRGVGRAVAGVPGPAANRAKIMLEQRAGGEAARIAKAVKKGIPVDDYYAAEDAFLVNLREQAAPIYKQAYEAHQSLTNPALNRLLTSKVGQQALGEARFINEAERASGASTYLGAIDEELTQAAREAVDVGKMASPGRPGVIKGFSLETWNQIKMGFDSLLDKPAYRNELTGRLNKRGHAVDQMRRTLLKELDKATGGEKSAYAKARGIYSGDAEVLGALRDGRKAMNLDPEQITRNLGSLSNAGAEAYRAGAARAMKDIVDKTPDMASATRRIFGNSRNRARLRAVFPDQDSYALLAKTLIAESRFAETKNFVLSGSQTAPRRAGEADLMTKAAGVAGVFAGTNIPGTHPLLAARMGRQVGEALMGPQSTKFNVTLAKALFNRNQSMNQNVLDQLMERKAWQALPEKARRRLGRMLLLAITQQEGKAVGAP